MSLSSSRSTANAKLLAHKRRQQNNLSAKSMSDKFTQKQSRFELRNEEMQAKQFALPSHSNQNDFTLNINTSYGNNMNESKEVEFIQGMRSPFAHKLSSSSSSSSGMAKRVGVSTIHSPMLGLNEVYNKNNRNEVKSKNLTNVSNVATKAHIPHSRSARRIAKYQLRDENEDEDNNNEEVNTLHGNKRPRAAVNVSEFMEHNHVDHSEEKKEEEEEGSMHKLNKKEKFQQVMTNSKYHRAERQRERSELDATTLELDKEINSLMHLLPKRNKEEEERASFMQRGSPEVRALLAEYKKNHIAKQLKISSSGEVSITPLTSEYTTQNKNSNENENNKTKETQTSTKNAIPTASNIETTKSKIDKNLMFANQNSKNEDDFDTLLYSMYSDERKAYATERTLDEDDELWQEVAQERIAMDRSIIPNALHTLEDNDALQLTRQEWIAQDGGTANSNVLLTDQDENMKLNSNNIVDKKLNKFEDKATKRTTNENESEDDDDDDDKEDNIDIPSSYEGETSDSDNDDNDNNHREEIEKEQLEEKENTEEMLLSTKEKNTKESVKPCVAGSAILDNLLSEIEHIANLLTQTTKSTNENMHDNSTLPYITEQIQKKTQQHDMLVEKYQFVLHQLHSYALQHPKQIALICKRILVEAEKDFLRGNRSAPSHSILLYCDMITHIFPLTDYRHQVITPLILFICSLLMQMKLTSLVNAHHYCLWTALLLTCLRGSTRNAKIHEYATEEEHQEEEAEDEAMPSRATRFTSEIIVALFNLISLQLPKSILEPARFQLYRVTFPLLERHESPLFNVYSTNNNSSSEESHTENNENKEKLKPCMCIGLLDQPHSTSPESILLSAYYLMHLVADSYRDIAAFEAMLLEPFDKLDALLTEHIYNKNKENENSLLCSITHAHELLKCKLKRYTVMTNSKRTPLAMRRFRPRPLRQFDPLLAEREGNAVKNEIRIIKHAVREDKKRVIRQVTAEATVQRRAHERASQLSEIQRQKQYNVLMSQLQSQQHTMKTVDAAMSRAKNKPRKGISGAPKLANSNLQDSSAE